MQKASAGNQMLNKMIKADLIVMPNVQDVTSFFSSMIYFSAAHDSYKMSQMTIFCCC